MKDKNIILEEQLGFVPGNRTSDAHLIIYNLVKQYCHKEGKRLHACFVDFKKAFDSIARDKLFEKIKAHGITGKIFNTLKSMYINDCCKVKIGNRLSETMYPNLKVYVKGAY